LPPEGGPLIDLFRTDFLTRDCCGPWHPAVAVLYGLSNCAICAAYVAIPSLLLSASRASRSRPVKAGPLHPREVHRVRWWLGLFVLVCGIGHLEGGVLAWVAPAYHAFAVFHLLTALISWKAVFVIAQHRIRIVEIL